MLAKSPTSLHLLPSCYNRYDNDILKSIFSMIKFHLIHFDVLLLMLKLLWSWHIETFTRVQRHSLPLMIFFRCKVYFAWYQFIYHCFLLSWPCFYFQSICVFWPKLILINENETESCVLNLFFIFGLLIWKFNPFVFKVVADKGFQSFYYLLSIWHPFFAPHLLKYSAFFYIYLTLTGEMFLL